MRFLSSSRKNTTENKQQHHHKLGEDEFKQFFDLTASVSSNKRVAGREQDKIDRRARATGVVSLTYRDSCASIPSLTYRDSCASIPQGTRGKELINPFRTAALFWGQTSQFLGSLSPKRDCGPKRAEGEKHPKELLIQEKKPLLRKRAGAKKTFQRNEIKKCVFREGSTQKVLKTNHRDVAINTLPRGTIAPIDGGRDKKKTKKTSSSVPGINISTMFGLINVTAHAGHIVGWQA